MKLEIVWSLLIAISLIGEHYVQNGTTAVKPQMTSPIELMKNRDAQRQQKEAERVWERAVTAKGGRDRLYAVRNMVISTRKDTTGSFANSGVRREELLVFPNKYWFWDDYRPQVLGLRVSMYNYDTNMFYVISDGEPHHPAEPIKDKRRNKALRNAQLSLLLETRWLKPTIIQGRTGRIGSRPVDVVETMVEGERVDFAFDQKTHLPVQVSYHDVVKGKTYVTVHSFSDYTDVGGIKVPTTQRYTDGSKYKATFRFNVNYNEDIFVKPPSILVGPDVWKPR